MIAMISVYNCTVDLLVVPALYNIILHQIDLHTFAFLWGSCFMWICVYGRPRVLAYSVLWCSTGRGFSVLNFDFKLDSKFLTGQEGQEASD